MAAIGAVSLVADGGPFLPQPLDARLLQRLTQRR